MILTSQICHSSEKCEIKCPESPKKITTQYKFCLMDQDAKSPGGGRVKIRQNLTDVFYGWPLRRTLPFHRE